MKKQFADYETARMLKDLKFSEPCFASHQHVRGKGNIFEILSFPCNNNDNGGSEKTHSIFTLSAPLWQQVKQWIWEKHKIRVATTRWITNSFDFTIHKEDHTFTIYELNRPATLYFDSPITAEIEGIKKAVKYLHKNKK